MDLDIPFIEMDSSLMEHITDAFLLQVNEGMPDAEEREARLFPDKEHGVQKITCHDLTREFLIFGTDVSAGLLPPSVFAYFNRVRRYFVLSVS